MSQLSHAELFMVYINYNLREHCCSCIHEKSVMHPFFLPLACPLEAASILQQRHLP